jgi:hypothetical protein
MRLGALMLLAAGSSAQLNRGSLTGTPTDQTGGNNCSEAASPSPPQKL